MKNKTPEEISIILNSPELIDFLVSRLTPLINGDSDVCSPRIFNPLDEADTDSYKFLEEPKEWMKEEFCPIKAQAEIDEIQKSYLNPEEHMSEMFWDEPTIAQKDGWLAGGAIANLIFEYIYGVPAVVNDVDFFYYDFSDMKEKSIDEELYNNLTEEEDRHYWIEEVSQVGLINKIKISIDGDFTPRNIIDCFDLNCTEAAFHWSKQRLTVSRSFSRFLASRTIEFSMETDEKKGLITSYIRGLQKEQDLQCPFVDKDVFEDYAIYNYSAHLVLNKPIRLEFANEAIGRENAFEDEHSEDFNPHSRDNPLDRCMIIYQKKLKVLENNPDLLAPYFKYDSASQSLTFMATSLPWYTFYKELKELGFNESTDLKDLKDCGKILLQDYKIGADQKPLMNQNTHFFKSLARIYFSKIFQEESSWDRLFNLTKDFGFTDKEKQKRTVVQQINFGEDLKKDFSVKKVTKLRKLFSEHIFLKNEKMILKQEWSLKTLMNFFLVLRKQHLDVIGTWESSLSDQHSYLVRAIELMKISPRDLLSQKISSYTKDISDEKKFIEVIKALNNLPNVPEHEFNVEVSGILKKLFESLNSQEPLKTPINIKPFNKFAEELVTSTRLSLEGQRMHHCVGGYGSSVSSGRSLIFHLKLNGFQSTLEVNVKSIDEKGNKIYVLGQNKAVANAEPHKSLQLLATRIISYLNNYNETTLLKKFKDWHQHKINNAKKKKKVA